MGAGAGRAVRGASNVIVPFLDDWSIATTATDTSDIANLADADYELANPQDVFWRPYGPAYRERVIMVIFYDGDEL